MTTPQLIIFGSIILILLAFILILVWMYLKYLRIAVKKDSYNKRVTIFQLGLIGSINYISNPFIEILFKFFNLTKPLYLEIFAWIAYIILIITAFMIFKASKKDSVSSFEINIKDNDKSSISNVQQFNNCNVTLERPKNEDIELLKDSLSKLEIENYELKSNNKKLSDIALNLSKKPLNDFEKGISEMGLNNFEKAIAYFEDYNESNSRLIDQTSESEFFKGNSFYKLKKYNQAIQSFDKAIKLNPRSSSSRYNKGLSLIKLRKYKTAIPIFNDLISNNPKSSLNYLFWSAKGYSFSMLHLDKEALISYKESIRLNDKFATAWINIGFSYNNLNSLVDAVNAFIQATLINPDIKVAWCNRAFILAKLQKYNEAIFAYDKAILIDPYDSDLWVFKGAILFSMDDFQGCFEAFDKAILMNPDSDLAFYNKGCCLADLNEHQDAVKAYSQAIKINPDYYDAWHNKAISLNALNDFEESLLCKNIAYKLKYNKSKTKRTDLI